MKESEFIAKMAYAECMESFGEHLNYWDGYILGLQRRFGGGVKYVTGKAHQKLTDAIRSFDRMTVERGRGYRDALTEVTARTSACQRCHKLWMPRVSNERPHICPYCKSPYWDRIKTRISSRSKTPPASIVNAGEAGEQG